MQVKVETVNGSLRNVLPRELFLKVQCHFCRHQNYAAIITYVCSLEKHNSQPICLAPYERMAALQRWGRSKRLTLAPRTPVVASLEPEAPNRATVEAQAAGVHLIVSDHGAAPETVLALPDTDPCSRELFGRDHVRKDARDLRQRPCSWRSLTLRRPDLIQETADLVAQHPGLPCQVLDTGLDLMSRVASF